MPLFALEPVPARLDDPDWEASTHRGPCFVAPPDEATARMLAAAEFFVAIRPSATGSPALPVLSLRGGVGTSGDSAILRSALLAQAPPADRSGRAAGPAGPAISRPTHHRRRHGPGCRDLPGLCRVVAAGAQPLWAHGRRPALAGPDGDAADSGAPLPLPQPFLPARDLRRASARSGAARGTTDGAPSGALQTDGTHWRGLESPASGPSGGTHPSGAHH
jgi:hypothetical protein